MSFYATSTINTLLLALFFIPLMIPPIVSTIRYYNPLHPCPGYFVMIIMRDVPLLHPNHDPVIIIYHVLTPICHIHA